MKKETKSSTDLGPLVGFALKAVIFDLDGLMVDTEPLAKQAWNEVLRDYDLELEEELFERMIGLRLQDSARMVIEELSISADVDELGRKESLKFQEILASGLATMPGLNRLLISLQEQRLPWAVATSSGMVYAKRVLSMIDLLDQCQAVAAGDEVANGKPHPDLYLLASGRLGIPPENCLALEDSVMGCQSAHAAGMATIAIPSALLTRAQYDCADLVLNSLGEVAAWIDQIHPAYD